MLLIVATALLVLLMMALPWKPPVEQQPPPYDGVVADADERRKLPESQFAARDQQRRQVVLVRLGRILMIVFGTLAVVSALLFLGGVAVVGLVFYACFVHPPTFH